MTNLTRRLGYLALLGLGACTPAKDTKIPSLQAFESYRQMLRFDLIAAIDGAPDWRGAPADIRRKLAMCMVELALAEVASARMGDLDAYARDPKKLPVGLRAETLTREAETMAQSVKDDLAPLEPFCKDDAALIRKYADR